MSIVVDRMAYRGVMVEQTMEPKTIKTIAFTGLAYKPGGTDGVTLWAYQTEAAPSGISDFTADGREDGHIYDLQGHLVGTPRRSAIYVRGGKKFVYHRE